MGRDFVPLTVLNTPGISTHTPAWGVTVDHVAPLCGDCFISTHTPAWGVTWEDSDIYSYIDHFNSHARVGRDSLRALI